MEFNRSENIAIWKTHGRTYSPAALRSLGLVRQRTRELIAVANAADASDSKVASSDTTSSRDLKAVRALSRARQDLLESVQLASVAGIDNASIWADGIDRAVSSTIVMSELAYFVFGELKSEI